MYNTLTIKDKEYKLRLSTKSCVELEKKMGKNPVNIFVELASGELPKMNDIAMVLHACLQAYEHGISLDDTYNLIDDYIEEGHVIFQLMDILTTTFQECGFIAAAEDDSKN